MGRQYNHREASYPEMAQENRTIYTSASILLSFPILWILDKIPEWGAFCISSNMIFALGSKPKDTQLDMV